MQVSAEIRWFWRSQPPPELLDWFARELGLTQDKFEAAGEERTDKYIVLADQVEIGIKHRGNGGLEVKGLVAILPEPLATPSFAGPIEIWTKWQASGLDVSTNGGTITTHKKR